jgi:hypothetical protein
MDVTWKETRFLRVPLTDEELQARGEQLAQELQLGVWRPEVNREPPFERGLCVGGRGVARMPRKCRS